MKIFDDLIGKVGLAMADKGSPWGKSGSNGSSGGGSSGGGSDGGDGGDDGKSGDKASGDDAPSSSDKPSNGPRNPWSSGGDEGEGSGRPRKTANIENIFKNRGPEGPRRGGGSGGGNNFTIPTLPGGKFAYWLVAIVAVGIWLFSTGYHKVELDEQGIVTSIGGKYSRTLDPGPNFTWPWPFQQVSSENVQGIRLESIGGGEEKLILTGDQNLVDLSYFIRWNIKDLKQYKFQLADPEDTVREAAEATMRASVAELDLDNVRSGSGRAQIQQNVQIRMQAILDAYGSGIAVQGIEMEKTDPPEQVVEAFNDVLAAQQNAEQTINQARRYAQQLLAQAQGEATAFDKIYVQYRLAPEVTRQRLYYETMEAVLHQTDKTIIETEGVTPYLPLPEVNRRSQANAAASNLTVTAPQGGQ